jgi:hypothetical protein
MLDFKNWFIGMVISLGVKNMVRWNEALRRAHDIRISVVVRASAGRAAALLTGSACTAMRGGLV